MRETPDRIYRLSHGLRTVAAVTAGPEIVERQSQVWPLLDWDLMISVQMLLPLLEPFPQFGQNLLHLRRTHLELPEVHHHVWFPAAVHAPPLIADETENT